MVQLQLVPPLSVGMSLDFSVALKFLKGKGSDVVEVVSVSEGHYCRIELKFVPDFQVLDDLGKLDY